MNNLPHLITDLGLILGAAAVITLLFKRLKQPIVLGYIIAGLLVSPHFPLFPTITDNESVEVWAQIGVIFLLFGLGLEFSFKKLIKVGGSAGITAVTEIIVMMTLGISIGIAMGWSRIDAIFLGGILSISSTTIIIRSFDELGVKGKSFVNLVIGVLVIQDIVAIIMLVLLPTLAVSRKFSGFSLLFPVAKLGFFLVLWFVSGIYFLPTVLKKAGKFMSDEMLLVTSLALCFLMVIFASNVGFSPALGAFIMGSILAETRLGGKIEHLTKGIKDLFGAVFFISVGMMIDLTILPQYWVPILIISLAIIIVQPLSTIIGALLSGQPLKMSVQAGMSFAQIGEFSFIIAGLGLSMNITSPFLYPIAVAASAVTTFTTPYMIRFSSPVHSWLQHILPQKLQKSIRLYSIGAQTIKSVSDWKIFIRSYLVQVIIYTVIIIGIILLIDLYVIPFLAENKSYFVSVTVTIFIMAVLAPFLWALAIKRIQPESTIRLWNDVRYRKPLLVLRVLRVLAAILLAGFLISNLLSYYVAISALGIAGILFALNYKKLQTVYERIEHRFIANLNDKEELENIERGTHLVPWDAHITNFTLTPDFTGIGKTLSELQLREKLGVNVAMIKRGLFTIQVPDRGERIYPGDNLYIIGTDEQVEAFKQYLQQNSKLPIDYKSTEQEVSLQQVEVIAGSDFDGITIKESAVREKTKGLIVGIERGEERILNPDSSAILYAHDRLWIVGNKKRIRLLIKRGIVSVPQ